MRNIFRLILATIMLTGMFAFVSVAPNVESVSAHALDSSGEWRYYTNGPYGEAWCDYQTGKSWWRYRYYQVWQRWDWYSYSWRYSHTHTYWGDFVGPGKNQAGWCG